MIKRVFLLTAVGLAINPLPVFAEETDTQPAKELFEQTCSACHSLALPQSQRLDRTNWEWVVGDMVDEFGCSWINEEQQKTIIDYLVENYGPTG